MNAAITQLYQGLTPQQELELFENASGSPKMSLLLELLKENKLNSTVKAISYIYEEEKKEVERATLANRFYKLRQKLRSQLLEYYQEAPSNIQNEEKQLAFVRLLLQKRQFSQALDLLKELEQDYFQRNLFEYLPEVSTLLQRVITSIEPLDKEALQQISENKQEYLKLYDFLHFCIDYKFQMHSDIESFPKMMQQIRRKLKNFKNYPRFQLIYHLLGFHLGVYWEAQQNEFTSALSRHFNRFNELKIAYPDIPLLYPDLQNREELEVRAQVQEAVYYYSKDDNEACKIVLGKLKSIPELLRRHAKEADLFNLVLLSLNIGFYEACHVFLNLLEQFQELQYDNDSDAPYYAFVLILHCREFPNHLPEDPQGLIQKVFLRLEQQELASWIYEALIQFCILFGAYRKARILVQEESVLELFREANLPFYASQLLDIVEAGDKLALGELLIKLEYQLRHEGLRKSIKSHLQGTLRLARHFEAAPVAQWKKGLGSFWPETRDARPER